MKRSALFLLAFCLIGCSPEQPKKIDVVVREPMKTILAQSEEYKKALAAAEQARLEEEEKKKIPPRKEVKPQPQPESKPQNTDWFKQKWGSRVVLEGAVSSDIASAFDRKLASLPQAVLNKVFDRGFKIVITTKNIGSTYYEPGYKGSMSGLFCSNGYIYISATSAGVNKALYHEIGHFIDYSNGWLSRNDAEFIEIYKAERGLMPNSHHRSRAEEFFAEVFQQSLINPGGCPPRAYQYILRYSE